MRIADHDDERKLVLQDSAEIFLSYSLAIDERGIDDPITRKLGDMVIEITEHQSVPEAVGVIVGDDVSIVTGMVSNYAADGTNEWRRAQAKHMQESAGNLELVA